MDSHACLVDTSAKVAERSTMPSVANVKLRAMRILGGQQDVGKSVRVDTRISRLPVSEKAVRQGKS